MADQVETALQELLDQLKDAEVFASMDPAEVNTPGGWLAVDGLVRANVAGDLVLQCSLYLVAADNGPMRATVALAELYTKTRTVLTPDGPVTTIGVALPADPTPLPGLRVPINLHT